MRRANRLESELSAGDLFRPLLAAGAAMLIGLVVSVAVRCRPAAATPGTDFSTEIQAADALEGEVQRLAGAIDEVRQTAADRELERNMLATAVAEAERDLAERRAALDSEGRKQYDLSRDLALAKADLERLEKRRQAASDTPEQSIKIENFPTPLSRPVDNQEVHFQLKGGRLAYVPFPEFKDRLRNGLFQEKAWKLKDAPEFTDTLGPVEGFHIRYTMSRVEIPWEEAVRNGAGGAVIQLDLVEFLPTSSQLGESVADALSNRSAFRGHLDDMNPKRTTVTLWVYPDSFEQFRFVRKELYQLGFTVAGRPTSAWRNIGGSSHGSKSAAE